MKKAKLLLLTLLALLGYSGAWADTVSPYSVNFDTNPGTSSHDFAVAPGWDHIVGIYQDSWGDGYMTYSYSSSDGIDDSGTLLAYRQYAQNQYADGAVCYDLLVTPIVSGEVKLYVKKSISASSTYPAWVEFYDIDDSGASLARGSLIQKFTLDDMEDSDVEGWKLITLNLDEAKSLGIRAQYTYLDNFSAASADIVEKAKLSVKTVADVDGASTTYLNQQADGSVEVRFLVTLTNTGTVDVIAGETENYTLSVTARSYTSGANLFWPEGSFAIPVDIAAGATSEPFEMVINVPAEKVAQLPSNGWCYWYVYENVSGTFNYKYAGLKKYESKFVFDKSGTTYYSNPSATTTPISFGKVAEATTLNYEIYNAGTAPLTINSITLPAPFTSDAPADEFTVEGGEKYQIAITFPATEPGVFADNLTIEYTNALATSSTTYTLGISGTVIDSSKNWITFSNADDSNGQFPEGSIHADQVYISYNSSTENYYLQSVNSPTTKFITPLLTAEAGESFTFDAWYSSYNSSAAVTVYTSTDRITWTQIAKETYSSGIGSAVKTFTATIAEAGDYYLAFELTGNTLLDNIYGLTLAATPEHDWYVTEEATIPSSGTQNNDYTASIKVQNISADADEVETATFYLDGEAMVTVEGTALDGNTKTAAEGTGRNSYSNIESPTTIEFTFKPHNAGSFPAYIELKSGDTVLKTEEVEVTIAEEVAVADAIVVGSGTSTSYSYAPIDLFNFEQARTSDILYTAAQLEAFGIKEGDKITKLAFKGNASAKTLSKSSMTAWVGLSTGDITYGEPSKDDMTEITVYNPGEMVFVSGENFIDINLPTPLVYDGTSDLRIYLEGGGNGEYISFQSAYDTDYSNMKWSNATSMKYNPLLYVTLMLETHNFDASADNIFNNLAPEPLEGATITIRCTEKDVEYSGVTDANGKVLIPIVQDDLVYDYAKCELEGYATEELTNQEFSFKEADQYHAFGMTPCIELTISASGYATLFYENVSLNLPNDLKAYTAQKQDKTVVLTDVGGFVDAGNPVVISGEPGDYQIKHAALTNPLIYDNNDLVGSEEGGKYDEAGYKYYVLSWKDKNMNPEEVGFYYQSGSKGKWANVKAHQAFLKISEDAAADGFTFTFDDATAINDVKAEINAAEGVYTISGVRVNDTTNLKKGIYIVNGKKVVIK